MTICHPNNILWVDYEATGLMNSDLTVPLEGAAIITDGDLNELAVMEGIAIHATEEELSHMSEFVLNMHTKTGLLEKVRASTVTRDQFDATVKEFAAPYFPIKKEVIWDGSEYRGMIIGGNSVKFDFAVMEKFLPQTMGNMDYRVIDISSLGELFRRWAYDYWKAMPPKASDHTALTDIRAGVDELRYYRAGMHLLAQ